MENNQTTRYYKVPPPPKTKRGRKCDPSKWMSGPDLADHDKYYGWLQHRSQAKFRKESYDLTFEQWLSIWPANTFYERGRGADSLCLVQIDRELGWNIDNVEQITQREHRKRAGEIKGKR